jgi:cobalt-zinc-cadmium efflux system protein
VASIKFRATIFFPGLLLADQAFSFSISAGNKAILMSHDHDDHDHASHANAHAPASFGKAFAIGIALNTGFVALEAAYGFLSNSVALLADAGHNLSDVLGLIVAWTASVLTRRAPTPRFTYGLRGSSILAALFNAMFLLLAVGAIAWEALQRFGAPEPVAGKTVMAVAAIGIAVNGVTAWLFAKGGREDINIRGAFAHMAADALVSAGVVAAGLVILLTNWLWLDPLVSLVVSALIVWGTWGLLRESLGMSMAAVPSHIDPAALRAWLETRPGVTSVHDLHIWPMSTTETALTCHLVVPGGHPGDAFLRDVCTELVEKFRIGHATLQIETDQNTVCALAADEVV